MMLLHTGQTMSCVGLCHAPMALGAEAYAGGSRSCSGEEVEATEVGRAVRLVGMEDGSAQATVCWSASRLASPLACGWGRGLAA